MVLRVTQLLAAFLILFVGSSSAAAGEVVVNVPFAFVRVATGGAPGPRVIVRAPFTNVVVGAPQPGVLVNGPTGNSPVPPNPNPAEPIGEPIGAPRAVEGEKVIEPAPAPALVALTHPEFARAFKPQPGTYEVVLLHPDTRAPVPVRFTLPPGYPKKVRVERHELEYDYGHCEVEIRFRRDGRVSVEYNH